MATNSAEANLAGQAAVPSFMRYYVGLHEGANHAVFGGGAGIDGQRHARTGGPVVAMAILLTQVTDPGGLALGATVERGIDAQREMHKLKDRWATRPANRRDLDASPHRSRRD